MLTIWKGLGWIAPVVFIAAFVDVQFIVDYVMGDGFYTDNRWVRIIAVMVVAVFVFVIGCVLNHKGRITKRLETGEKGNSFSHTLLFLPIELWAVIVPCVVLGIDYFNVEQENKTLTYLEAPKVNDIYFVDFSKIFNNEDPIYKYGTMIVVSVNMNLVQVQSSTHAYDGKSGVRKDIHSGKANEAFYYSNDVSPFNVRELVTFYNEDAIFSVKRE